MKKKYKIIAIEWEDITFFKGSYSKTELKDLQTQLINSVGYLIREEGKYLLIALSVEKNEPYRLIDVYKIPKANIIKKRFIK